MKYVIGLITMIIVSLLVTIMLLPIILMNWDWKRSGNMLSDITTAIGDYVEP